MKVFGIDPGSARTGYGCVASDGSRHRSLAYGVIAAPAGAGLPEKLHGIHRSLAALLAQHRPDCVAIENIFHAKNVRSALVLGHARGVAVLAAVEAGVPVIEYSPAEIKVAVTGYGRADKPQMQKMVQVLLGLDAAPSPHDAADALAVALCHLNAARGPAARAVRQVRRDAKAGGATLKRWRDYRPGMTLGRGSS